MLKIFDEAAAKQHSEIFFEIDSIFLKMTVGGMRAVAAVLARVTKMTDILANTQFDGIFGLGFPEVNAVHKPWFQSAFSDRVIAEKKFAIWLNRDTTAEGNWGELSLGTLDEKHIAGQFAP